MIRVPTILACLTIAGLVFAGCGGAEPKANSGGVTGTSSRAAPTTQKEPASTADVVKVSMKDIKYIPATAPVRTGQTVKWVNDDAVAHTVTATSGASFDSGTVPAGGTYSWKATKAGTVKYFCTIHGPQQSGTLEVSGG